MTVFDVFDPQEYTFLRVTNGTVRGNTITEEVGRTGVFKLRSGVTSANGIQTTSSTATMHVRPEDYANDEKFVGNGVRYEGVDYQITGVTAGRNFDGGVLEHWTLSLERGEYGG